MQPPAAQQPSSKLPAARKVKGMVGNDRVFGRPQRSSGPALAHDAMELTFKPVGQHRRPLASAKAERDAMRFVEERRGHRGPSTGATEERDAVERVVERREPRATLYGGGPANLERIEATVLSSVLYEDDKIVAFNKPAGLRLYRKDLKAPGSEAKQEKVPVVRDPVVEDVLPRVAEQLGCDRLFISTGLDKECSGAVVLAKHPDVDARLRRYLVSVMTQKLFVQTFSVLTLGVPSEMEGDRVLQLTTAKVDDNVVTRLVKHTSNRMVLRGDAVRVPVRHRVVFTNPQLNVALVDVQPVRAKWNSVEVYVTNVLRNPILGELTYSAQVRTMMNRSFVVSPRQGLAVEDIPADVATALGLDPMAARKAPQLPVHVHRSELQIPPLVCSTSKRRTPALSIRAPLPRYFQEALKLLKLLAS